MKKIDLHCHVIAFPEYSPRYHLNNRQLLTAEEQIEIHDKTNVGLGVLLPIVAPEGQWAAMPTENCKYIVDKYPDRFTWFCNVDPRAGRFSPETDLSKYIGHYKELGAKGVGEVTAQLYADSALMDNLFYHCAQCDMPVLIHVGPHLGGTYGVIDDPGLPRIEKMLKKHHDLKLIGHSAAFWWEISESNDLDSRNGYPKGKVREGRLAKLMREYGNLYCDLSAGSGSNAMMRDPEYAASFLTEFSDRIYYGADVCYAQQTFQYDFDKFLTKLVDDKMITLETYQKIIRKNAERLLNIQI